MKKINFLVYLCLNFLIFTNTLFSKSYNLNEIVNGNLNFDKKLNLSLSEGNWKVIGNNKTSKKFPFKSLMLIKLEENTLMEAIWLEKTNLATDDIYIVDNEINLLTFKNDDVACSDNLNNYFFKYFKKGSTHNCFLIRFLDILAEEKKYSESKDKSTIVLNNELEIIFLKYKGNLGKILNYTRSKNINLPKNMIESFHSYFSRLSGSNWYILRHYINPSSIMKNQNLSINFEQNKTQLDNNSYFKNLINNLIINKKEEHSKLEKKFGAKKKHFLVFEN